MSKKFAVRVSRIGMNVTLTIDWKTRDSIVIRSRSWSTISETRKGKVND